MSIGRTLGSFASRQEVNLSTVVKGAIFRVGSEITAMSPTDKGTFKANWMVGVGDVNLSTVDSSSRDSLGIMNTRLGGFQMGGVFYYSNNLPYAMFLEFGGSDQAPQGMVRLTARNIQIYVNEEIANI